MANTQDIRRRIKSIRNTAQITKAMQMVAASKMRKAQQHALAGRPYAALMNKVLVSLQQRTDPRLHPSLQVREVKKELVIVISTDKGLAYYDGANWAVYRPNLKTGAPEMFVRDAEGVVTNVTVETAPAHNYILGVDFQGDDIWVATAKGLSHGIRQK